MGHQLRSVEFARNHGVKLHVRSSFSPAAGTWVIEEDERMLEKAMISGVTHTLEERCTGWRTFPQPIFSALAKGGVNVDTIVQTGESEIVFSRLRTTAPPRGARRGWASPGARATTWGRSASSAPA